MNQAAPSRATQLCLLLFGLVLMGGTFAFGAVTPEARGGLALAMGLALSVAAFAVPTRPQSFPLLMPAVVFLTWTALHGVPLPEGVVQALSPTAAWARDLAGLPVAGPLAMVPEALWRELSLSALTVAWAWAVWLLVPTPAAQRTLSWLLVAIALLAAALAWAQLATGATRIYFFLPIPGGELSARRVGPLVNPNHNGALFASAAFICAALAATSRGATRAALWAAAAWLVLTTFATGSQGAMAALVCTATLLAWLKLRSTRRPGAERLFIAGLVGVAGFVGAVGLGWVLRNLAHLTGHDPGALAPRVTLWRDLGQLWAANPLMGIGAGAVEWAHPLVKTSHDQLRMEFAHNDWLQACVEGGAPVLLMLAWAAWLGCKALWGARHRDPTQATWALLLSGAAAAPLLHAFVDFPLHIPALAAYVAAALALALAAANPATGTPAPRRLPARALVAALAVATGSLAAQGGWATAAANSALHTQVGELPEPGVAILPPPPAGSSDLPDALLASAQLTSLEIEGTRAHRLAREDVDRAAPYLRRAQDLFHAARWRAPINARAARGQGWVRLYLGDLTGARALLEQAAELAPTDPLTFGFLARVARLERRDDDARAAYKQGLQVADRPRAFDLFDEIERAWPGASNGLIGDDPQLLTWFAAWHMEAARWAPARALLEQAAQLSSNDGEIQRSLALSALRLGDLPAAHRALDAARRTGQGQSDLFRLEGDVLLAEGEPVLALAYFRKARALEPSATHAVRVLSTLAQLERWPTLKEEAEVSARNLGSGRITGPAYQRAEVYRLLGLGRLKTGDPANALLPLVASLGELPGHSASIAALAQCHQALGDPARAVELLRDHLAQHPDDARVWLALGETLASTGDTPAARQALRRALDLKPGWQPARQALKALPP